MKKSVLLIYVLFAGSVFAQTDKIIGDWLLTNVIVKGESREVYNTFRFMKDGTMETMGIPFGTWKYNPDDNSITLKSRFGKDFNGKAKVKKLTGDAFEINSNGTIFHYDKLDREKVIENNRNSRIAGTWQYDNEERHTFLKFDLPDVFVAVTTGDGSVETLNGSWLYFPKDSNLIISAISTPFRGKNIVEKISDSEIVIKTKDGEVVASKVVENPGIDSLAFTEDDLPEEDISKLPWQSFDEMVEKLSDVKYLKYRYGKLLPKVDNFVYTELIKKVKVNSKKPSVEFSNLTVSGTDTSQYSQDYKDDLQESYNMFFPMNEYYRFRIVGTENVNVPAGEFNCTVVEAVDGDDKYKLWLINDLPGIYAKIIKVSDPSFGGGDYTVEELEEIKK